MELIKSYRLGSGTIVGTFNSNVIYRYGSYIHLRLSKDIDYHQKTITSKCNLLTNSDNKLD